MELAARELAQPPLRIGVAGDDPLVRDQHLGEGPGLLARPDLGQGGSWGTDGYVYFTPDEGEKVYRVHEDRSAAEAVTKVGVEAYDHLWPESLPEDRGLLVTLEEWSGAVHPGGDGVPVPLPIDGFDDA